MIFPSDSTELLQTPGTSTWPNPPVPVSVPEDGGEEEDQLSHREAVWYKVTPRGGPLVLPVRRDRPLWSDPRFPRFVLLSRKTILPLVFSACSFTWFRF